jgi:hypothetical protein
VVFAIFHNTLDWTAVGTLALALVTAVALLVGSLSLRQTKSELALSRREVEEAHRPVVVPVRDPPNEPRIGNQGFLDLPVQNIGTGPALRVEVSVFLRTAGAVLTDEPPNLHPLGSVAGIAVAQMAWCFGRIQPAGGLGDFHFFITFEDVSGKEWLTVGRLNAALSRFDDVRVSLATEGPYGVPAGTNPLQPVPAREGWLAIARWYLCAQARRDEPRPRRKGRQAEP